MELNYKSVAQIHILNGFRGLIFLLTGLMLNGCVLAPPASEALIFRKESKNAAPSVFTSRVNEPYQYRNSALFLTPAFPADIHLSATSRPIVDEELNYARDKFSSFIKRKFEENSNLTDDDLIIRNAHYLSVSLPLPLVRKDNVYWSLSAGLPVLGSDATARLGPRTYFTANLGFLDGELILQRKVLDSESIGLAVGTYYRTERRGFEIAGDEISLVPFLPIADALSADRIFYNHIAGGRLNAYLSLENHSYIQFRAAPGYALNLKEPLLNFSLTLWLNI